MQTRTVTALLEAPRDEVYGYLSKVENLPKWATEFARELKYETARRRWSTASASSTSRSTPIRQRA
jgi:uncharacterized membrane protein